MIIIIPCGRRGRRNFPKYRKDFRDDKNEESGSKTKIMIKFEIVLRHS